MKRVIWCTPGSAHEPSWISGITGRGFSVVRRCVEATDLLAAASIEPDALIVVDVDTPRLAADIVAAIPGDRARRVIVLATDERGSHLARSWGLASVIQGFDDTTVDQIAAALQTTAQGTQREHSRQVERDTGPRMDGGRGRVVVVYGPIGSPGRSTLALGLAESWARVGERVCLVDADTLAPSLALLVGMTEDISGVLVAARYADQGVLDARSLGSACRRLDERLWLMSGISSPERWAHARPSTLQRVWAACAQHFDRVVIDANALLNTTEFDDPLAGALPVRDCATRSALEVSDAVVVVTKADPVSVARVLGDLPHLVNLLDHSRVDVIVNRSHGRGSGTAGRVRQLLAQAGFDLPVHVIAEDRSIARCLESGALAYEVHGTVRYRRSLGKVRQALAA